MRPGLIFLSFICSFAFGQTKCNAIVSVQSKHNVSPVEGAVVRLFVGDSLLVLEKTNSSGKVNFHFFADTSMIYSIRVKAEPHYEGPPIKFIPKLENGEPRTFLFDISLMSSGCSLGMFPKLAFEGSDTKDTTGFSEAGILNLLKEYPNMVIDFIYVPRENEPKKLMRKRIKTMKFFLSNHNISFNRFSFSSEEYRHDQYCQGCFQARVISM